MIRPATPEDAAGIVRMEERCFGAGAWSARQVTVELLRRGGVAIVVDSGRLEAYATGWALAGEAELLRIAVDPPARRRGLGATLLTAFEEACAQGGARSLFLEVAADNDAAVRLYERQGYTATGRRAAYYAGGADALLMSRPLATACRSGRPC